MEIVPFIKVKAKRLLDLQVILDQSRNSIKQGKGLSSNQFWEKVEENVQVSDAGDAS